MSIILSSLREEKTNEEIYNEITGGSYIGRTPKELDDDIQKSVEDNFTSKIEHSRLTDLQQIISYQNKQQ